MAKITGIGGAFLKAKDPKALYAWYEQHLGIVREHGSFMFPKATVTGTTVLSFFPEDSNKFTGAQRAMLNFRVDDLDTLLGSLVAAGVEVDPRRESYDEFGKFGWFTDPEGNRVELWQPTGASLED